MGEVTSALRELLGQVTEMTAGGEAAAGTATQAGDEDPAQAPPQQATGDGQAAAPDPGAPSEPEVQQLREVLASLLSEQAASLLRADLAAGGGLPGKPGSPTTAGQPAPPQLPPLDASALDEIDYLGLAPGQQLIVLSAGRQEPGEQFTAAREQLTASTGPLPLLLLSDPPSPAELAFLGMLDSSPRALVIFPRTGHLALTAARPGEPARLHGDPGLFIAGPGGRTVRRLAAGPGYPLARWFLLLAAAPLPDDMDLIAIGVYVPLRQGPTGWDWRSVTDRIDPHPQFPTVVIGHEPDDPQELADAALRPLLIAARPRGLRLVLPGPDPVASTRQAAELVHILLEVWDPSSGTWVPIIPGSLLDSRLARIAAAAVAGPSSLLLPRNPPDPWPPGTQLPAGQQARDEQLAALHQLIAEILADREDVQAIVADREPAGNPMAGLYYSMEWITGAEVAAIAAAVHAEPHRGHDRAPHAPAPRARATGAASNPRAGPRRRHPRPPGRLRHNRDHQHRPDRRHAPRCVADLLEGHRPARAQHQPSPFTHLQGAG